jgi:hypothetical protein
VQRVWKQRLAYGVWGLIGGLILLFALPTFWAYRWPRPLAADQLFVLVRRQQMELWQFDPGQQGVVSQRPWGGGVLTAAGGLWQVRPRPDETSELALLKLPGWTEARSLPIGGPFRNLVVTSDGHQFQVAVNDPESTIAWIDSDGEKRQERPSVCRSWRQSGSG